MITPKPPQFGKDLADLYGKDLADLYGNNVDGARAMLRDMAASYGLDHVPPLIVGPNQAAAFKAFGLEEGRDYIVYGMLPT